MQRGPDVEIIRLSVPRATSHLRLIRKVVALTCQQLDFPEEEVDRIELAVDEACSNAIVHAEPLRCEVEGSAQIHVELHVRPERLTIVLKDGGAPFDFEEQGKNDLEEQLATDERGGLGIMIMRQVFDEVRHLHSPAWGNVITLSKSIPAVAH